MTRRLTGLLCVLALAAAGACLLVRKRVSDPFPVLCGMILLVSVLSMAFGLGHSRYKADRVGRSLAASNPSAGSAAQR